MMPDELAAELYKQIDARQAQATGTSAATSTTPTLTNTTKEPADTPAPRGPSQATRLVDMALGAGELWHSHTGDAFITIDANGHREHHRLKSANIRDWLAQKHHRDFRTVPNVPAINDALGTLSGMARYDGQQYTPAVRIGGDADTVYLDLGDADWRTVTVTADGWQATTDAPVRFIRSRGSLPLPEPTRGGHVDSLRELLTYSDDDHALIVGWISGAMRPNGPYPPVGISGEQGTGKSVAARILKRTIDPHEAELRAEPRTIDDLMIAASRSRVPAFDNLSHIPPWLSDALCRISTGGVISKRELFTDAEETIIEAIKPVIITSINNVIVRGDLLDRAIAVNLSCIPNGKRRTEADILRRYNDLRPGILGALLDGCVSALRLERQTRLDNLPRMADWAVWVTAAEPGIGWPQCRILDAYRRMRDTAEMTTLDGDALAVAIRVLLRPWEGTADELRKKIEPPGRLPRGWPESPRALAGALRRMAPALRRAGVEVILDHREARTGRRLIRITSTETSSPSSPSSPGPYLRPILGDATGDATPGASSPETPSKHGLGDDGDDGDANPGALLEGATDGLF